MLNCMQVDSAGLPTDLFDDSLLSSIASDDIFSSFDDPNLGLDGWTNDSDFAQPPLDEVPMTNSNSNSCPPVKVESGPMLSTVTSNVPRSNNVIPSVKKNIPVTKLLKAEQPHFVRTVPQQRLIEVRPRPDRPDNAASTVPDCQRAKVIQQFSQLSPQQVQQVSGEFKSRRICFDQ